MKKISLLCATLLATLFLASCSQETPEQAPALYQKVNYDGWSTSFQYFDVQLVSCYGTRATNTIHATLRITPKVGTSSITFPDGRTLWLTDNTATFNEETNEFANIKYQCSNVERTFNGLQEGVPFDVTFDYPNIPTSLRKIKFLTFENVKIVFNSYVHSKWFTVCTIPYYPLTDSIVWN